MLCPKCQQDISPHHVACPKCLFQLGFPNVRAAEEKPEREALELRYRAARDDAATSGYLAELEKFENEVSLKARAAICKRTGLIQQLLKIDNSLFQTFYQQLQSGRDPEDNEFDRARQSVDSLFFPYFYQHVHFAALSIDGYGPRSYGECSFSFKPEFISHRTSLFEENTLVFCNRYVVPVGRPLPVGFRAIWEDRAKLAAAKLHRELAATPLKNYAEVLLKQKGGTGTDEFIEVHIYGDLQTTGIEAARAKRPALKADEVLLKSAAKKLKSQGIELKIE